MITVILSDLLNSTPALSALLNEKIPATLAFKMAGIIKECETHFKSYETAKLSLHNKYGMKDEEGSLKKLTVTSKDESGNELVKSTENTGKIEIITSQQSLTTQAIKELTEIVEKGIKRMVWCTGASTGFSFAIVIAIFLLKMYLDYFKVH